MAITEVYVDPAIAAASGAGTIGDPYGDLQHALDTKVRDATNGDRFNIKAGTDEILAAALDVSTYGTPIAAAPLWFEGYTAAQGDGGIGGISGDATYSMFASTALDYIGIKNMHLHNSGAADIIHLDNSCSLINCEVDDGATGIHVDSNGIILNCYVHNIDVFGIRGWGHVSFCYVEEETRDMTAAFYLGGGSNFSYNICKLKASSSSDGGQIVGDNATFWNNTIWADGGDGDGINIGAGADGGTIYNNIIEGFSGAGGEGINITDTNVIMLGYNAFYDNETNITDGGASYQYNLTANDQILVASPLVDPANGDFRLTPLLKGLGYADFNLNGLSTRPYMDMGGMQGGASSGGHPWGGISYWRHRP